MEPIYSQSFTLTDNCVDRYGRLKTSQLLYYVQEVSSQHVELMSMGADSLEQRGMFWAILRQKVQISRLPRRGETITVETWPMPTTRSAYPRSVIAYDRRGEELFRSIALWVLMDSQTRSLILPGKSGIVVSGGVRGNELSVPGSISPQVLSQSRVRPVCFTDLDRNGHMNNTRYLDWIDDLLPSAFHESHTPAEITVVYLSEAREGQELGIHWDITPEGCLQVEAHREKDNGKDWERIFSARILF